MSASANSDSDSGGEENSNRDNESIASPKSESSSRSSSSTPQSPVTSPQSPSPQSPSPPSPRSSSPQSPRSPYSIQSPESPQSPSPQSPSPRSPSSIQSPESPQNSEMVNGSPASSPPASPASSGEGRSSPRSQPQSPASENGQESDEGQASDAEDSNKEASNHQNEDEEAEVTKADNDKEEEGDKEEEEEEDRKSDAGSQSEAEESENEENIPEVNIESADENEDDKQFEKDIVSDNEMEHDGEEDNKEDAQSVHVDSDAENKSDNEEIPAKMDMPASPPTSPLQTAEKEVPEVTDNEDVVKADKPDSDAEDHADSDSDADSDESEVGGLIADIFGESDDDEEFEGFNEDDIGAEKSSKDSPTKIKKKRAQIVSDSEDEKEDQEKEENEEAQGIIEDVPAPPEGEEVEVPEAEEPPKKKKKVESEDSDDDDNRKMREDFVSDFDIMMQKKKEESSKRRRRRDVDLISDSDDLIADIISQMRQAAEEDKILNKQKKTATKKLKILPMVMSQLKKQDLKTAFLDQGVLNVIAEWLTPLPDRSLPHLNIREGMMKQLGDLPPFDQSLLKSSGIGRALMYLFKHPKETKENREKAGKLITEWARPIFNVTTNYHSLTKEEREQRDYDHVPQKKRKLKDQEAEVEEAAQSRKDIEKEMDGEKTAIRPGDKGWIGRARVPMPSTKDYVNRPKWNKEMEFFRGPTKKPLTRIEKHIRSLQDKKRQNKNQRAITCSIEGRKMAI